MSYLTQFHIAGDSTLKARVTACVVNEGIADPTFWVEQHAWQLSAQPGWVDAYKNADGGADDDKPDPGADETAITDQMILDAVQALSSEEATP